MSSSRTVAVLIMGYGIAAWWALSWWFPLTGATPGWFPFLTVGLGAIVLAVAVGIARGERWALVPAVVLGLIAMLWSVTWLAATIDLGVKAIAFGVPLVVITYVAVAVQRSRLER
jgi:hypothetical protein